MKIDVLMCIIFCFSLFTTTNISRNDSLDESYIYLQWIIIFQLEEDKECIQKEVIYYNFRYKLDSKELEITRDKPLKQASAFPRVVDLELNKLVLTKDSINDWCLKGELYLSGLCKKHDFLSNEWQRLHEQEIEVFLLKEKIPRYVKEKNLIPVEVICKDNISNLDCIEKSYVVEVDSYVIFSESKENPFSKLLMEIDMID